MWLDERYPTYNAVHSKSGLSSISGCPAYTTNASLSSPSFSFTIISWLAQLDLHEHAHHQLIAGIIHSSRLIVMPSRHILSRLLQLTFVTSAMFHFPASAACDECSCLRHHESVDTPVSDHVKTALKEQHWQPVELGITCKLCLFMH